MSVSRCRVQTHQLITWHTVRFRGSKTFTGIIFCVYLGNTWETLSASSCSDFIALSRYRISTCRHSHLKGIHYRTWLLSRICLCPVQFAEESSHERARGQDYKLFRQIMLPVTPLLPDLKKSKILLFRHMQPRCKRCMINRLHIQQSADGNHTHF